MQSDPIGLDGGENSFVYVGDNPLVRVDESGLLPSGFNSFNKNIINGKAGVGKYTRFKLPNSTQYLSYDSKGYISAEKSYVVEESYTYTIGEKQLINNIMYGDMLMQMELVEYL